MSFPVLYPPPPNQTDYTAFLRSIGFDTTVLPDNSPYIPNSLQTAIDTVNGDLAVAAPNEYTLAVYNLATDVLINYCPDQTPALASLVWASGTVTAVAAAALPTNIVNGSQIITTLAGQSPAAYSGTQKALVVAGNSFTYPLASDPGAATAPGTYSVSFFADLRKQWNINAITTGVVTSTFDEGTGTTVLNPEQMKAFTQADLQTMKTPYGRAYIAFAQKYGQTLWGLS